jgi:hypothetical protein
MALIPCSRPEFWVCWGHAFAGVGQLTFDKGSVIVESDGEVRVSLKGVRGPTAVESGPPYTLQLFFFAIARVTSEPIPPASGLIFTTDGLGNFERTVGSLPKPAIGFFTINSRGVGSWDYWDGGRQQFITGDHP